MWADKVVAYVTSVGKLGSVPHQLGKLAGVGFYDSRKGTTDAPCGRHQGIML